MWYTLLITDWITSSQVVSNNVEATTPTSHIFCDVQWTYRHFCRYKNRSLWFNRFSLSKFLFIGQSVKDYIWNSLITYCLLLFNLLGWWRVDISFRRIWLNTGTGDVQSWLAFAKHKPPSNLTAVCFDLASQQLVSFLIAAGVAVRNSVLKTLFL